MSRVEGRVTRDESEGVRFRVSVRSDRKVAGDQLMRCDVGFRALELKPDT